MEESAVHLRGLRRLQSDIATGIDAQGGGGDCDGLCT